MQCREFSIMADSVPRKVKSLAKTKLQLKKQMSSNFSNASSVRNEAFSQLISRKSFQNTSEAARHRRCSVKQVFLRIQHNSQESTCAGVLFNKLAGLDQKIYQKEITAQRFSCEICKILITPSLKNICELLLLILQEKLFNSSPRILYFNKYL